MWTKRGIVTYVSCCLNMMFLQYKNTKWEDKISQNVKHKDKSIKKYKREWWDMENQVRSNIL